MRLFPATSLVGRPGQIGFSAIVIAHNGLRKIVIHIAPKQNSVIGQLLLFNIIAQMLENNQSIVLVIPHRIGHPFKKGYSGGIVGAGPGSGTVGGIGKALGKVEAKSVNPKLVHPKNQDTVDQNLGMHAFVIKIVAPLGIRILHVVVLVVPGIIGSGFSVFKIHLKQGRLAVRMIQNNVHNHHHAAFVTGINKGFIIVLGTVSLVGGKKERRIIAPAVVALELIKRHQLNGIDPQTL